MEGGVFMVAGRKPKPTHIHLVNGNPSKKNLETNEPKPKPIPPKCPKWLDKEAKAEWKRIEPELDRLGLLTIIDGATLAGYCQSYSRWVQAEKVLTEHGLTYEYINKAGAENSIARPEVAIAQKYLQLVKSFCTEFGLTPSSRSRINLPMDTGRGRGILD